MVRKAFFRANIPFSINKDMVFSQEFAESLPEKGWTKCDAQGDLLLRHMNTAFNENAVCFSKVISPVELSIQINNSEHSTYNFTVSEIHAFCFDTGVGIVSLHIPYDNPTDDATLTNTCAILRCSAEHNEENKGKGIPVLRNGTEPTYLTCIAEEHLKTLFNTSFTLFEHLNRNSMRRVDMFSAVLCENNHENNPDYYEALCYRLANAHDNRDKAVRIDEARFYRQQDYTRWGFSKRGCSVVANLTNVNTTDNFLSDKWFHSVKSNYFYLYMMVLHQKYAIYSYLNTVAADAERNLVKANQESLIEFNSKYIFSVASDEQLIQTVYLHMKEANNVDEVYSDLQDELKRLFEYSRMKAEEINEERNTKLNFISVIVSVLCSVSIILDTLNMFAGNGYYLGFDTQKNLICTSVFGLELLFFFICFAIVILANKKKK